jgi:hypothetical protein
VKLTSLFPVVVEVLVTKIDLPNYSTVARKKLVKFLAQKKRKTV